MKILSRLLLAGLLAAAASIPASSRAADEAPSRAIPIAAKRFEFEPKEIRLRKGEPVTLAITSEDVTHGFFSRPLHVDEDLAPGETVRVSVNPTEAGTYTIICDHYCGSGHGGMKMTLVVE